MAACLARAAAYNDMGPKDFILRTLLEMIQNKGQHMGTPLQQELDQLGTTTLKTMAFISPLIARGQQDPPYGHGWQPPIFMIHYEV
jgi:hypothetical protein